MLAVWHREQRYTNPSARYGIIHQSYLDALKRGEAEQRSAA